MKKTPGKSQLGNYSGQERVDALERQQRCSYTNIDQLRARVDQLETSLDDAKATSKRIAQRAYEDAQAHNARSADRESVMAGLQKAQAGLLQRIDDDATELADSALRMRDLSTALVLAHEDEQRRIGRELHDQIGQDLTALKNMLRRGRNGTTDDAMRTLQEAEALTEELLQTVRNICSTLRPQMLDDLGLAQGLQWHIKTFAERTGLEISFDARPIDESRLSPIVMSTIFRVIQEALTNVGRHAETKSASVTLGAHNGSVEFSIRDSGKGFDVAEASKKNSTGLSGMRERLSLVQGRFEMSSWPGKGTMIRAQIPLPPAPANLDAHKTPPTLEPNSRHGQRNSNQSNHRRRSSPGAQGPQVSAVE